MCFTMQYRRYISGFYISIMLIFSILYSNKSCIAVPSKFSTIPSVSGKITINEVPISLTDLCNKLSNSEVRFYPGTEYAHQELAVEIKDQPVTSVLSSIAKLLVGHWEHGAVKSTYYLKMDTQAYEERIKWWKLYTEYREEALHNLHSAIVDNLSTSNVEKIIHFHNSNSGSQAAQVQQFITNDFNLQFYNNMPVPFLKQYADKIQLLSDLRSNYSPVITSDLQTMYVTFEQLPHADQILLSDILKNLYNKAKNQTLYSKNPVLQLLMQQNILHVFEILKDNSKVACYYPNIDVLNGQGALADELVSPFNDFSHPIPYNTELPEVFKELGSFPKSVFKDNLVKFQLTEQELASSSIPKRRTDKLEWFAKAGGLQYISDYYNEPAAPFLGIDRPKTLPKPLEYELNEMAVHNGCSWQKQSSGIVLVRDNKWFREDGFQVPQAVIAAMWQMVHAAEAANKQVDNPDQTALIRAKLQLDLEAYAYQHLNTFQLIDGLMFYVLEPAKDGYTAPNPAYPFRPFESIVRDLFQAERLVKFYSSLTDSEKQEFVNSRLNFGRLSEIQQNLAAQCCPALFYTMRHSAQPAPTYLSLVSTANFYADQLPNPGFNPLKINGILPDLKMRSALSH